MGSKAQKRAVYDMVDERYPWLWDEPGAPGLTDSILEELRLAARDAGGRRLAARDVETWVRNPERHSPHYDEVLVARALDFDLEAWQALSYADRQEFGRRLAAMDDPFSEYHPFDEVMKNSPLGGERIGRPFPRRERLLSWPENDRDALRRWFRRFESAPLPAAA